MCLGTGEFVLITTSPLRDKSPEFTFKDPSDSGQPDFGVSLLTPLETPGHLGPFLRAQFDGWKPDREPTEALVEDLNRCRNGEYYMRGCVTQRRRDIPCFPEEPQCYGQSTFANAFKYWYFSGVRSCDNLTCKARKEALERSAPECRWAPFRDIVLTCIACWRPAYEVLPFDMMLPKEDDTVHPSGAFCIDVRGMVNLWLWATRLISGPVSQLVQELVMKGNSDDAFFRLWQTFKPDHNLRATESSRKFHERGFCVNRLWNVSFQSRRGIADIPYIVEKALESSAFKSGSKHMDCTEESCLIAHENSTLVKQAHKCPSGSCSDEVAFPPVVLNKAFDLGARTSPLGAHPFEITAWRIPGPGQKPSSLCTPCDDYVAISHVWSDGTGVGMKSGAGIVNACLFEYFSDIAKRDEVSCNGVWWDAISIPTERHARAIAMDSMLENYENAKVTVVHDQDLLEFEWKEDGSPAVAMVLSSWFTRGWTAAELWASRGHPVKVLFKDPNDPTGQRPLIKDLDMDILAGDLSRWFDPETEGHQSPYNNRALAPTDTLPELAHMIATDILALFRWTEHQTIPDLQALLRMLQTRVTSWARDRTLIAALLCLPRDAIDSTTTTPQMTQKILANFGSLRTTEIINHRVPMSSDGPWDWAPQSIFELGQWSLSNDPMGGWSYIQENGSIKCEFLAYEVLQEDVITEYRHHPALAARISVALSKRRSCLLLTTRRIQQEDTYILFQPVSVTAWMVIGRWIGCVSLKTQLGASRRHLQVWNKDSNGRDIIGLSPPTYVLGKSRSSIGKSLPVMNFESAFSALEALRRNTSAVIPKTWCLSTSNLEEPLISPPQPVYIYGPSAGLILNIGRTGPTHPSGTVVFDTKGHVNWIQLSFFSGLIDSLNLDEMVACPKDHDGCNGVATITWSLPCSEGDYYACWAVVPLVYTYVFHVTTEIHAAGGNYDMAIGSNTFNDDIKAHLIRNEAPGTYLQTCNPCGKCTSCLKK
ncbi:hypothetical protein SAMD00023353_0500600 [Rosellinia necatrix]|uniref:Heterokaryon incompatibility domain-containing protein n=1 Tax=Rosellinia necatrix TaxID=77044 RepID=A0A1S7UK82_ROSNE|nr:hypothetical protein SAMD00023353_0500600 [Rosellinia necatrix]